MVPYSSPSLSNSLCDITGTFLPITSCIKYCKTIYTNSLFSHRHSINMVFILFVITHIFCFISPSIIKYITQTFFFKQYLIFFFNTFSFIYVFIVLIFLNQQQNINRISIIVDLIFHYLKNVVIFTCVVDSYFLLSFNFPISRIPVFTKLSSFLIISL